jgi:signal transduction histidine kinase
MMIIYFINGLCFGGLGLAAYLQLRQGGDFALKKQLPWLAAFGFVCGMTNWIDMFLASGGSEGYLRVLSGLRMISQPLSGLLLLKFGWGLLRSSPLPAWTIFVPGILIVPVAYVITYAATTFVTPSPIEIPIDIWSRYLLYLPGSLLAGIGFVLQWDAQRKGGQADIANLMLGAGLAFLFEAFVVGLVVPAAPYGPASYYNYDRVLHNAFTGEAAGIGKTYALFTSWLDYNSILQATGLPIEFWRMLSALTVTFFVVRGLGVFDAVRKRQLIELQEERDGAQRSAFEAQMTARQTAENWTDVLVSINRRITELQDVDSILLYIVQNARKLLRSDFVGLALLNDDLSTLDLKCFSQVDGTDLVRTPCEISNPLILKTLDSAGIYRSQENEAAEMFQGAGLPPEKTAKAIAIVRLALDNRPIGALWMAKCEAQPYSETDLIWLDCMADQVVIAIQHGLMTSQLQSLSITEERARIAREMHDGLAQVLGYLNIQVQTLEALLKQGKNDALEAELSQMRDAIRVAHADVRENILSLRTTLASEKGLTSAIDEYLQEFGIQTGIETQFENEADGDLKLASVAEVQLVCILQEALANVRKHANAAHVNVLIARKDSQGGEKSSIYMRVSDDGIGFLPRDSKGRFGLQTMKERASSVNGSLVVKSDQGKGTVVECTLPCLVQEKLNRAQSIRSRAIEPALPGRG